MLSLCIAAAAGRADEAPVANDDVEHTAGAAGGAAPAAPAPARPAPPAGTIEVRGFRFTGNLSIPDSELQALLAGYVGTRADLDRLRKATDEVSDEYRRRGLTFARAYLPPQEIEGGVVEIAILEGQLGEVVVEGNTNYSSEFVRAFIVAAVTETALAPERLERGVLLLNDFKDLKVTANLERGKAPGTVDVHAIVEDHFPLRGALFFNNFGSDFVSRYRFGAQFDWTNALISGALLTGSGVIGERPDHLAYGSGAYMVPVGSHGTKVGLHGSYGHFEVAQDLADLGIYGESASGGISISHPFVKTRTFGFAAEVGFEIKNSDYFFLDQLSSRDRIRIAYIELSSDLIHWAGKSFASFNVSQGLGDFLDGTHGDDPLASRIGADDTFTRLMATYARLQPLNDYVSLVGRFSGQWSSDSLVAGEQWLLGGADSVRGYAVGETAGDHGYSASLEVRVSPLADRPELVQLLAFVDHGGTFRKRRLPGQDHHDYLTGAGLGFRSHIDYVVAADLRLDVGWPIEPNDNSLNENPVMYVSVAVRF